MNVMQAMSQIHDELHKGNVEAAHRIVHTVLGIEDGGVTIDGRKWYREFDAAFNTACRKNNVLAAYVIFDHDDPNEPRKVRVLTGGELSTLNMLKLIIAAGQHAIAEPA